MLAQSAKVSRAVVMDFGLAHETAAAAVATGGANLTNYGTVLGTPEYMAPEQFVGAKIGPPAVFMH